MDHEVLILDYDDCHQHAYATLHRSWLQQEGFEIEPGDARHFDAPRPAVLDRGGDILVAMDGAVLIGSCALVPREGGDVELCKLAVARAARNRGLGARLLEAAIARARQNGFERLILITNSRLHSALRLYRRFGFRPIAMPATSFEAVDLAMALDLAAP